MNTLELKSELIDLINEIEDSKVLGAIYLLLTKQFHSEKKLDFWDELPEDIKNGINAAIKEADDGNVFSYEEVKKEMKEKYNVEL